MPRRPSPRPLLRLLAAPVLALVVSLAVAAPAHAGKRTIIDTKHDVLKQVGQKTPKPAVNYRFADVKQFVTILGQQKITLSTTVRDMPKNYWAMLWQIQTDAGTTYALDLLKTGNVKFELTQAEVPVECVGMTRSVNPVKSKITVTIPLTCLGMPTSVRTGAGAAATSRNFGRIYTDDAILDGVYQQGSLALGRPVKRG